MHAFRIVVRWRSFSILRVSELLSGFWRSQRGLRLRLRVGLRMESFAIADNGAARARLGAAARLWLL